MIYLDNNATSFLAPAIAERMRVLSLERIANPSSQHAAGRRARSLVEAARDRILAGLGARTAGMGADQLLFTSGGTEANNLALFGLSELRPGRILVSAIEHPSVLGAADRLRQLGRSTETIPVTREGLVDLEALRRMLTADSSSPVSVVSVMAANNETGVLQPIESVAALCQEHRVLFHCDAVQMLGKVPICFEAWKADAMTVTAHKIHGPVGIGGLILRHGIQIAPQMFGGFQQLGLRPGTEAPILCDAFAATVEEALSVGARAEKLSMLRDRLEAGIVRSIEESVVVGREAKRLPHTLSVSFPGVDRQALQVALDLKGIACSTGSACASGSSQPSHVLQAMHLPDQVVKGGIRFSVSTENTKAEIDRTIEVLVDVVASLRKQTTAKWRFGA
ncbi:Cysteine desulfurase [Pirellula sp. SH-Sr6A]|uniref:cysteine desulfurase family protein n=1 Tax=Pirellula sp. SH-Sr6A TaxID=1632865 RepID=UPI00078B5171|nr:cysteine desulfurase family protein [Pirellula sp. SH-Sr6A]AMV31229.1 Cysteine desulfurase [Pirellula sp. SH-Sr6A]